MSTPGFLYLAGWGQEGHLVWKLWLSSKSQFLLDCVFTEEEVSEMTGDYGDEWSGGGSKASHSYPFVLPRLVYNSRDLVLL